MSKNEDTEKKKSKWTPIDWDKLYPELRDKVRKQRKKTAYDPKPWIRVKPMPRPWRKDKKPLPLGPIAKEYIKKYGPAKKPFPYLSGGSVKGRPAKRSAENS